MCEHIQKISQAVKANCPWTEVRSLITQTPTRNYGSSDRYILLDAARYIIRTSGRIYEGVKSVERFGMGKVDRSQSANRPIHTLYAIGIPV